MCVVAFVDILLLFTAGLRAEPRQHTKNGKKILQTLAFLYRSTLGEFMFDIYILSLQSIQGLMMTLSNNE